MSEEFDENPISSKYKLIRHGICVYVDIKELKNLQDVIRGLDSHSSNLEHSSPYFC